MDAVPVGVVALELVFLVVKVWALVLALVRPGWAFQRAGSSKGVWVIVLAVGLVVPILGGLVAIWYLFSTDRTVRNQQQLGPGIGFPGGV